MRKVILYLTVCTLICCHKSPDTSQLTNKFVVITNRDKAAIFGDYKTFFISDTVAYISNVPGDDSIIVGDPAHVLINTVKNNIISKPKIITIFIRKLDFKTVLFV